MGARVVFPCCDVLSILWIGGTNEAKMASMRFPFSFPQPQPPQFPRPFTAFAAVAAVAGASAAVVAVSSSDRPFLRNALNSVLSSGHSLPLWGSLSLSDSGVSVLESKTGTSFPSVLASSHKLCGIGLRKKSVLGLKKIDVYAFGMPFYFGLMK